ncbi:MAG: hypothetical protein R6W31_17395 [Bacteroidales bacterium]
MDLPPDDLEGVAVDLEGEPDCLDGETDCFDGEPVGLTPGEEEDGEGFLYW